MAEERNCNKCIYSTRDGNCVKWTCDGTVTIKNFKEQVKKETFDESINILKGLNRQIADMFENIVKNSEHYNS